MQIYFAVARDCLDDPENVGVLISEQDVRHGIAKLDGEPGFGKGPFVPVRDAVAVTNVDVENFEGRQELGGVNVYGRRNEVLVGILDSSGGGRGKVGLDFKPRARVVSSLVHAARMAGRSA